ncbi:MAG: hypothetical protein Fur0023_13780 [Bacteroidia bacterium]
MDKKKNYNRHKGQLPKIHIGQIIQEKLNTSGFTVSEFAEKIHLSRPAVYQMFKKQSIDSDLLVRISLLLKENFVKYIYHEVEQYLQSESEIKHPVFSDECQEKSNKVLHKLEVLHQDLLSIKNILIEMKEVNM